MTTRRTFLSLIAATALCMCSVVSANAVGTVQSCTRLSGVQKATCEWQNHKVYQQQAAQQATAAASSAAVAAPLPSCSRLHGQDLATCLWKNHKAVMATISGSSSSAPRSVGSSSSGLCSRLVGSLLTVCKAKSQH